MDLFVLALLFVHFFSVCAARWFMAVRPVYDLANATQTLNRIQRNPKKPREFVRLCRKDKQCGKEKFCYKQTATCHSCRWGGQLCRRNHMCCKGFACVSGFCKPVKPFGAEGSFCRKSRDCQRGLCCSKTSSGERVCRRFLQEGDACGSADGSPFFKINHFCACDVGLKCKRVKRASNKLRGNLGWFYRRERRCVRIT